MDTSVAQVLAGFVGDFTVGFRFKTDKVGQVLSVAFLKFTGFRGLCLTLALETLTTIEQRIKLLQIPIYTIVLLQCLEPSQEVMLSTLARSLLHSKKSAFWRWCAKTNAGIWVGILAEDSVNNTP